MLTSDEKKALHVMYANRVKLEDKIKVDTMRLGNLNRTIRLFEAKKG